MGRVPIIRVDGVLIASVQDELTDRDATQLQEELTTLIEQSGASGVLLDVSLMQLIDSFLGRTLHEIALGARLLGAETVVAGIQPAVAMTLVELGLELNGVHTALNAERGLKMLNRMTKRG
ncbi:MAG: STAS domain-containing protein [Nitrolancea sp.]